MKKVGIFGGTFDPIHFGHLSLAENIYDSCGLDTVIFIPAYSPLLREGKQPVASSIHRYNMTKLAISECNYFEISDVELLRKGPSYMIDTVETFLNISADIELFLIIGSDNIDKLPFWHRKDELLKLCTLLVYERPGYEPNKTDLSLIIGDENSSIIISGPQNIESATEIRKQIYENHDISHTIPKNVLNYIMENKLYLKPE
ncbi:MAG TPA: nicotinate (nicotinamide) nucleotide adenylyltransferase [Dehalococcoidia bacterium]|jgi:nicotinate-nucleotide adenylyltransferase|nr:nicotinate (nicotinamide) nucleotide adenylyltransferase [Dehalococcoidia bacterium]|tara:strand:+ start:3487 stop:4092 length:606 start_codon:yes stop_codon:yes gene_type:complete